METLKRWKLECPLLGRDTYLTFSVVETTTVASSKKEGTIGILAKCSLRDAAGLDPCSDCPRAAEFYGLPVNLE